MLAAAMEDDMIDDAASEDNDDEDDLEDGDDAEEMEDEDEEGFTDLEDENAQNGTETNGKGKKASLYKAPTAEEMEELRRQEEERGGHFGFAMKVSTFPIRVQGFC